ncbi:MAG TPA: polyprenyl synthetase family protein [Actinoplanes sp.]|jgi:geranylgeranyl pyrophosphate synthase
MSADQTTVARALPDTGSAAAEAARDRLLARAGVRIGELLTGERARWPSVHTTASEPIEVIEALVGSGGKRLRPAFVISGYLAAGGDEAAAGAVVDAAAAIELLHAFLLLHDDVFDDSALRRGRPTAHELHARQHREAGWAGEARRYGEAVAILAGDLAHGYADRLAGALPGDARRIWSELREEVLIGQYLDLRAAAESSYDPRLSRWIAIIKSGRYSIQRPLALGAALAGRPDLIEVFDRFGEVLGEAFQLRDDLIDAYGDSAVTGKPARLDVAGHKMTLLLALAAEQDEQTRQMFAGAEPDAAELTGLIDRLGVREQVEKHIDDLVAEAGAALDGIELEPGWHSALTRMAVQVAYRDR